MVSSLNLIQKKTAKHIQVINNTVDHILRLEIEFEEEDIDILLSVDEGDCTTDNFNFSFE